MPVDAVADVAVALDGILPVLPGDIPVYNPLPFVITLTYNSGFYSCSPGAVSYVSKAAADLAVGPDNQGGKLSHTGLRRMYGPEERFLATARALDLTINQWCHRENAKIKRAADEIGRRYMRTVPKPKAAVQVQGSES